MTAAVEKLAAQAGEEAAMKKAQRQARVVKPKASSASSEAEVRRSSRDVKRVVYVEDAYYRCVNVCVMAKLRLTLSDAPL